MGDGARAEWPDAAESSPAQLDRVLAGWPRPGEEPPGPPAPVPPGRGGDQRIPRPFNARPGGPAPWAHLPPEGRRPAVADVRAALGAAGPPRPSSRELDPGPRGPGRPSAVLAP